MGFTGSLVSASGGLLDDFIQYILPTIIAACLFAPFFYAWSKQEIDIEAVLVTGVLIGYLLSFVLKNASLLVLRRVPFIKERVKTSEEIAGWVNLNWHYKNVFYSLTSDEQARMQLFTRHLELYRTLSFYLLLYLLLNVFFLIKTLVDATSRSSGQFTIEVSQLLERKTPMIFKAELPTWLVVLLVLMFFLAVLNKFIDTHAMVLGIDGHYSFLAGRIHQKEGGAARAIWGRVIDGKKPVPQADIELFDEKGGQISARVQSNSQGFYQFEGAYQRNIGRICLVRATHGTKTHQKCVFIKEKEIPQFEIDISGGVLRA